MMLDDLSVLLSFVDESDAPQNTYHQAVVERNCLNKRSQKTRELTYYHLVDLYTLDPDALLFRALRYLWQRDTAAHGLLALLCAYARDGVLRQSAPLILKTPVGTHIPRTTTEAFIDDLDPGRFSPATLKSVAQNVNGTWTHAGHLEGRNQKKRSRAVASAGAVAYALLLGYLTGVRGYELFSTEYARLLDCSSERTIELAEEASRKGWLVFKRVGTVMEVLFPTMIQTKEMEQLREQGQTTS
jgi:hypothetical protein